MRREIKYEPAPGFSESFARYGKNNPKIVDKMKMFVEHKCQIPLLKLPRNMRDYPLSGKLEGLQHCHLASDILLIYTMEADVLRPILLCDHDDLQKLPKKLGKFKK